MDQLGSSFSDISSFGDEQDINQSISSLFNNHLYLPHQDCPQPIFVQIPVCHNTQHQLNRQQTNEIKSELIKSEVECVISSTSSTQSTGSTTVPTVTIPNANLCPQQQTPPTLITARPKQTIKCFKCDKCPFISISLTGLDGHVAKEHSDNQISVLKKIKCLGCPNVFYSQNSLKVHLIKDHQMCNEEIQYLVRNWLLDDENVEENALNPSIKQKIYPKKLSILKAPEFRNDDSTRDFSGIDLYNNCNETNSYNKESEQIDLYEVVPDDFIDLIDNELNKQGDEFVDHSSSGDFQSKIFVKNVNNLKNPTYSTGPQFGFDNGAQDIDMDGSLINIMDNPTDLPVLPPIMSSIFQSQISNLNYLNTKYIQPKKKPSKIFIKNVDILPKPVILQTSGHSLTQLPRPQPENCSMQIGKENTFVNSNDCFLFTPEKSNESITAEPNQQKKIFIKNIDILKNTNTSAPVAKKHLLHLRSVHDINLMNGAKCFIEEAPRSPLIASNSIDNYNHFDEYTNINNVQCLDSVIEDFVQYYQNNENDKIDGISFQDMQNNLQTSMDFHLDTISLDCNTSSVDINLENIIESTTSSIDEKAVNKIEQFISNSDSQQYYNPYEDENINSNAASIYDYEKAFDEEIMFVCAEEEINSCEQIRDSNTTNEEQQILVQADCPIVEENIQCGKEISKNEEPTKGRIYVVSNLMKVATEMDEITTTPNEIILETSNEVTESNDEEEPDDNTQNSKNQKKGIGRPKGGKNNRYTLISANSPEKTYQCTKNCTIKFSTSKLLSFHEQCHDETHINGILCPKCQRNDFRSFNTLHTHLWRQHDVDMELFSCDSCKFKTPILSRLLNTHMRIHSDERNFKCESCDKAFKNSKQLKNHRVLHKEVRSIHKCEFCHKLFYNKKHFRNHIKAVHDHRNEFKCSICDSVFSSVSGCQTHMLNHTNAKKFQCGTCAYTSNDGSAFRRHLKIHEGSKPYECRYCQFRCIQSKQLKNHILRKHPKVAKEVIFSCLECKFVTMNQRSFEIHQVHHLYKKNENETIVEEDAFYNSDEDEILIKFN